MKRIVAILCLVAILAGALSGCRGSAPEGRENAGTGTGITAETDTGTDAALYSNLVDSDAQKEVSELLTAAGVSADSIESFLSMARDYNTLVGDQPYFHDGFTQLPEGGVDYDAQDTYTLWMDQRDYADISCRIAAYSLLRDAISAKAPMPANQFLAIDSDALDHNSLLSLSEEERGVFNALYNPVPVPPTTDTQAVQEAVLSEWKSRGISFAERRAAMVSVILHDELDNNAYVGHAGVLLPDGDGWLFVEKYSPVYPYQATKFQTREQVEAYLMDRLGSNYTEGASAKPFLLENDHAF